MTIKLLARFQKHEVGTVLELDEKDALALIEADAAVAHDPIADGLAEGKTLEEREATKRGLVDEVIAEVKKEQKKLVIDVKDRSEDDPTGGYCKNADTKDRKELAWGLSALAMDLVGLQATGHPSENLGKCLGRAEKQIKAAGSGLEAGQDSLGGALLPSGFSTELMTSASYESFIRPRAMRMNLQTLALSMPVVEDTDRSDGTIYGGVTVYWPGELGQRTSSRPHFETVDLKLRPLSVFMYSSDEMIKFSPISIGTMLLSMGGAAINWKEDTAFLFGTGAEQPLGMLNSGAQLTVDKETSQTKETIVHKNVVNAVARHRDFNANSIFWAANKTCLPSMTEMGVVVGTGGSLVWMPANGAAGRPFPSLYGYPLMWTEKAKTVGTVGDLSICDASRFIVADDQSGPDVAQSIHLKFDYSQTAFRIVKYVDGQPIDRTVFTPENGDTLSPFVQIQTRS